MYTYLDNKIVIPNIKELHYIFVQVVRIISEEYLRQT